VTARLLIGDVFEKMAELPDHSFDLICTSPPFWRQRAYLPPDHPDKALEIGQEASPAEFIDVLLRLTAEWRRLLTPHGSIAVELGDTMAGSGGAGGDYGDGGFRDGQPRWEGSQKTTKVAPNGTGSPIPSKRGSIQPACHALPKSHCYIPEMYGAALTYGDWPILTGNQHAAGRWIVRNKVVWCRPNPTPGDDGDKFRRATSLITCATLNPKRYWDGDAVREPLADSPGNRYPRKVSKADAAQEGDTDNNVITKTYYPNPDGTRPLYDHWLIAPQGYPGAHYAVWTPEIARRLILTMSPARVCVECGEPSRRLRGQVTYERTDSKNVPPRLAMLDGDRLDVGVNQHHNGKGANTSVIARRETIGWSHCGCGHGCRPTTWKVIETEVVQVRIDGKWIDIDETDAEAGEAQTRVKRKRKRVVDDVGYCADETHWRAGRILDPFGGSGTTAAVATGNGRDCTLIDINDDNAHLVRERVGMFLEESVA
jgi:hypothetical protein